MEETDAERKEALLNRYRDTFVDKLTIADLGELRFFAQNLVDPDRRINPECRQKLEFRLRQYFHEEVLMREMAGIEALLRMLGPEDLKKSGSDLPDVPHDSGEVQQG